MLITNRYYITTIIAIFLSLSLGILIGGTLGQQWINDNQQKLIAHYQAKAEEMQKNNEELTKQNKELESRYQKTEKDFSVLFSASTAHLIDGRKLLWVNDSNQKFESLRRSIELAGGVVYKLQGNTEVLFNSSSIDDQLDFEVPTFDGILFFPGNNEKSADYKWLLNYGVPVLYVTDKSAKGTENYNNNENEIYQQKLDIESLNEHYKFILFLKNFFQEKSR